MTFQELIQLNNADAHIDITFEYHNHHVYFFSPVMQITKPLSGSFFSSLLQIHLFGIAKNHCWFGYDTTSQHVILFCLIALDILTPDAALKH
ncbi:hypothetical protein BJP41_07440 [Candidatus Williamhamiltonella defendens]|uniref:Tir chaperone n=1 Tax=Candidatus Williamhamiltonella defendens TaxID=138072 RepID=A0A2D3T8Q1_9ENTR|nr:type III secretion system chaperone [Candidatus Hamiltonella defensa]ASV33003.1 hypothetical protein CJJ18_01425 [Candidatus Hamiltonella defensa]ATW30175.1 hypothetical protein BJP41_07440 [Candidatus Hamiltonella defensa]ATW32185.1 hypothetical protein BJP42_07730 [Candidatus Hamiltonella defensa]AWK15954.1 hypothetical protein CCS40_01410 [Candidatus Hamiltonella defensa]MBK4361926.1 hypothetical protein [Candidatus Hamiltonella defensa]